MPSRGVACRAPLHTVIISLYQTASKPLRSRCRPRAGYARGATQREGERESSESRGRTPGSWKPRGAATQLAGRAERLPGRAGGVHELAGRAVSLADDLRPLRPVVPHERPRRRRPRRAAAALRACGQQLRGLHRRPGQALRSVHAGRLRHRRRNPLSTGRGPVQPRRPRPRAELDHLPRRDRRLRRRGRARPEDGAPHGRPARGSTGSRCRGRTRWP